jgi:NAD+ synthase (glutamine-hydrolysing)
VQVIHDLHKSEVFKVGAVLGACESILVAPPSADLWQGQTDEDELGFSYDFIELFTELSTHDDRQAWIDSLDGEDKAQWDAWAAEAFRVHRRNKHKETWPINLDICRPKLGASAA